MVKYILDHSSLIYLLDDYGGVFPIMIIREVVPGDLASIVKFQPENWPDIIPGFKFYLNNSFSHPIKILDQDKMVDIGFAISFYSTAWLGHVIVEDEYRDQGVGTFIVDYLCHFLKARRARTISLITTFDSSNFYQKMGFKGDGDYLFFRGGRKLKTSLSANIDQLKKED